MSNITDSIYKLQFLDELSDKKTVVHCTHPLIKLVVTVVYIIVIASFGKYDISALLPLALYPIVVMLAADIPFIPIIKRVMIAVPFILGIGIFNLIFDKEIINTIFGIQISGGVISLISLLLKSGLSILAALILVATTGMEGISRGLRMLHVPKIFVLQITLMYRYISVLLGEAANIWHAYILRAPGQNGVNRNVWGPLAGQLLIRTYERALRVYQAMELRGFKGEYNSGKTKGATASDFVYCTLWVAFILTFRFINFSEVLGVLILGVGK